MKNIFFIAMIILGLTNCKKTDSNSDQTPELVQDIDGNAYHTVTIGNQVWMVENLKTTKYNDGTLIPLKSEHWNGLGEGYSWHGDSISYKNPYGALYTWFSMNTGKLAPKGFRVPTNGDWQELSLFLGDNEVAGGKMKEAGLAHWNAPNTGASNSSGFTALPAGEGGGPLGQSAMFWSSTTTGNNYNLFRVFIWWNSEALELGSSPNATDFYSVRCIKN